MERNHIADNSQNNGGDKFTFAKQSPKITLSNKRRMTAKKKSNEARSSDSRLEETTPGVGVESPYWEMGCLMGKNPEADYLVLILLVLVGRVHDLDIRFWVE